MPSREFWKLLVPVDTKLLQLLGDFEDQVERLGRLVRGESKQLVLETVMLEVLRCMGNRIAWLSSVSTKSHRGAQVMRYTGDSIAV